MALLVHVVNSELIDTQDPVLSLPPLVYLHHLELLVFEGLDVVQRRLALLILMHLVRVRRLLLLVLRLVSPLPLRHDQLLTLQLDRRHSEVQINELFFRSALHLVVPLVHFRVALAQLLDDPAH